MLYILQAAPEGGGYSQLIFLVAIIAIFYFFLIRHPNPTRHALMNFRSHLKKGASIITQGGIHGNIVSISESTVTISVDANTKLKVEKEFVFSNSSSIVK